MEIAWNKIGAILGMVAFIVVVILVGRAVSRKKAAEGKREEPPREQPK
ncbi:MAG TPA: hypothetical protein PK668_12420 [Myxococcota bacterium]|nr:hypothetical protein [Myxococcota bacterium]HRY93726.1 hypothetical protein [Myxococcota bacterium]HSA21924.1 hypothetical protein [Myxococcota bacterium]